MVELNIVPGEGIGPVKLGMMRSQVHEALAPLEDALEGHSSRGSLDYFFASALQIEYEADGKASFIGAAFSPAYTLSIAGRNPFDASAEELFALLATLDGGQHAFVPHEYVFPRIIVTVWGADRQYNRLGDGSRAVYGQIGVGSHPYLESVSALGGSRPPDPKRPLWRPAKTKTGMSAGEWILCGLLFVVPVVASAGLFLETPLLAGPAAATTVTIASMENVRHATATHPGQVMYVVKLPDGTTARLTSERIHAPGTRLQAMVARAWLTGRPIVSPPYVELPAE
jgi:hypothetical protein